MANRKFRTIEDIQARKEELREDIHSSNDQISALWNYLFTPKKANTKGEMVTSIISNSITAFDTFMLMRKLFSQYGHLFKRTKKHR